MTLPAASEGGHGKGLPSGPWYSSTSAFNTRIPPNPPIHPDSVAMVRLWEPHPGNQYSYFWLGPRAGPGDSSAPAVGYATRSTPRVTVRINFPNCNNHTVRVPMPQGLKVSSPPFENKLAVMLPNGDEWDLFDITPPGATPYDLRAEGGPAGCPASREWQAAEAVLHRPGWTGTGSTTLHWSDSNILFGAGIIRASDIKSTPAGGTWGHALMIDYASNCASGQAHPPYVYPATGSGGGHTTGSSCAPMGSRWQLDPSINCNTWPTMVKQRSWMKQMCRTFQVYGAIIGHSAGAQGDGDGIWTEWYGNLGSYRYPWQDPRTGAWPSDYSPELDLPADLLPHFRVIDWTKWDGRPSKRRPAAVPRSRSSDRPAIVNNFVGSGVVR